MQEEEEPPPTHTVVAANPHPERENLEDEVGATIGKNRFLPGKVNHNRYQLNLNLSTIGMLEVLHEKQLQYLNVRGTTSSDKGKTKELNTPHNNRYGKGAQALAKVDTEIRRETHFTTEFNGKDLVKDFTSTNPTLHEMEMTDITLANLDKLIEASGQVPPAQSTMRVKHKEPMYSQDETNCLILNIQQSKMDYLYKLPTDDREMMSAVMTEARFRYLLT